MSSSFIYIGIVFGGKSEEHEVSIESARTVVQSLESEKNSKRFKPICLYIDKNGCWWPPSIANSILKDKASNTKDLINLPLSSKGFQGFPIETQKVAIWFPVLHGPYGEDGSIQGFFKLTGKPFIGSGVLASAIGMDKLRMKETFASAGLPQLPYISANGDKLNDNRYLNKLINDVENNLAYPCFIKPANLGSSIGITKAKNVIQLQEGLKKAANLDKRLVIEKGIKARELECATLGNEQMQVSLIGEIEFESEWYDYETKYRKGSSQINIPASIPDSIKQKIQSLTIKACLAIGTKGLARVDFFYENQTNNIWINEINTLPGFTTQSMYPMLWEASGLSIEELTAKLIENANL